MFPNGLGEVGSLTAALGKRVWRQVVRSAELNSADRIAPKYRSH